MLEISVVAGEILYEVNVPSEGHFAFIRREGSVQKLTPIEAIHLRKQVIIHFCFFGFDRTIVACISDSTKLIYIFSCHFANITCRRMKERLRKHKLKKKPKTSYGRLKQN